MDMTHFCLLDLSHLGNCGYQDSYQDNGNEGSDNGNGVNDDGDHQVGDVLLDIGDLASKRREDCQQFEHLPFLCHIPNFCFGKQINFSGLDRSF